MNLFFQNFFNLVFTFLITRWYGVSITPLSIWMSECQFNISLFFPDALIWYCFLFTFTIILFSYHAFHHFSAIYINYVCTPENFNTTIYYLSSHYIITMNSLLVCLNSNSYCVLETQLYTRDYKISYVQCILYILVSDFIEKVDKYLSKARNSCCVQWIFDL